MTDIRLVWDGRAILGEGPVWDAQRDVLWFVDIKAPRVHRYDPASGAVDGWDAPAQVGWILPAAGGVLLAGLQTGLAVFDPATGIFDHLLTVEPDRPGNRLNDATVAPDGCVWFGSMDDGESAATGRVYRFDGRAVRASGIPAVAITNGPAFAPDGRMLYHVDTLGGVIYVLPVTPDGDTGDPRPFARIDPADGHPDGVSVDAAGNVWVGLWGGWSARCHSPDGTPLSSVRVPVANVTKLAFGGGDRRTAFVTTARKGLDDRALMDQPAAGGLFLFHTDVPGQALPLARLG